MRTVSYPYPYVVVTLPNPPNAESLERVRSLLRRPWLTLYHDRPGSWNTRYWVTTVAEGERDCVFLALAGVEARVESGS